MTKSMVVGLVLAVCVWMAAAGTPDVRYRAVPGGFEITDGPAVVTRPLYGSHVADNARTGGRGKSVVIVGCRPRVLLTHHPIHYRVKRADGVLEFGKGLKGVTFRYVEGRAEYRFADGRTVVLVRCADSEGLLAEVSGDVPHAMTGEWRLLARNRRGTVEYLHFGRVAEKPLADLPAEFVRAKTRLAALAYVLRVRTPEPVFDSLMACLNVAADSLFEEGVGVHGAVTWHIPGLWRNAYVPVTLARHDDVRWNARAYFASQCSDGRLRCHPFGGRGPYNMCEMLVDSLMLYWDHSADAAFFRDEAYAPLKRYLAWVEREMRVSDTNLFENWLNAWNTDNKWCNGGAGTIATAFVVRAYETMARIAERLGEGEDAKFFAARARQIRREAERLLYDAEQGVWGECRERFGLGRLVVAPDTSSIYTPIETGLSSFDRAFSSLMWAERNIPSAFADGFAMLYSSNRLPRFYSTCGLYPNETLDFAHAWFLVDEPEMGWRNLWNSIQCAVRGPTAGPGVIALTVDENLHNVWHSDMGDVSGVLFRATVEGLFGVRMDAPAGKVRVTPRFPVAWDRAEIETPYLAYRWTRAGGVEVTHNPLKLAVTVGTCTPRLVGAKIPLPHRHWGRPKGAGTDYAVAPQARPRPVALDRVFNRSWRTLHTGTFSPQVPHFSWSPVIPRTVRPNGRSWWEQPKSLGDWQTDRGRYNVPDRLAWPTNGIVRTAAGLEFRLGAAEGVNGAFCGLFEELDDTVVVPLAGRASKVTLLTALSTNPNQAWLTAARVTVTYADGGRETLELTPPDNCDDWLNYLQDAPYHLTGEHVAFGGYAHANVLALPIDPSRELKSLELQCLSTETICGLLAVTLY